MRRGGVRKGERGEIRGCRAASDPAPHPIHARLSTEAAPLLMNHECSHPPSIQIAIVFTSCEQARWREEEKIDTSLEQEARRKLAA